MSIDRGLLPYYIFRALDRRFVLPVWVVFMIDRGLSLNQIGMVAAACTVITFILEVPSGAVADHMGHRRALALGMLGEGIAMFVFLGGTFWWILAGALLYWGSGTLISGTKQAIIHEYLLARGRDHEYQRVMSTARMWASGLSLFGVGIAGFVYEYSPVLTFSAGAVLFFIGTIAIARFDPNHVHVSVAKEEGFAALMHHFQSAWKTIRREPTLFWLLSIDALFVGMEYGSGEFQPVVFTRLGITVGIIGIYAAIKRLLSFILAPILAKIGPQLSLRSVLLSNYVLTVAYFFGVAFVTHRILILFVVLLATSVYVISDIVVSDAVNKRIPSGSRATTLSLRNLEEHVFKTLCVLSLGWLGSFLTLAQAHLILGLIALIGGGAVLFYWNSLEVQRSL
ncbi:MFS transporter [Candidatus Uhrbacteria bacterium]|nr:MFS transporter [Candidatus Uhrbacteria bacterium]